MVGETGETGAAGAASGATAIDAGSAGEATPTLQSWYNTMVEHNPYFAAGGGLMVLGSALALLRSGVTRGAGFAYRQMLVDLEIPSKDKLYLWFLEWMGQHRQRTLRHLLVETLYVQHDNGASTTRFLLVPGPGLHLLKYRGCYMLVKRERLGKMVDMTLGTPFETIKLTTLYRDRGVFAHMLDEARQLALKAQEGKTVVYTLWGQEWRPFGLPRRKRRIDSVVLDEGLSTELVEDVRDFLVSGEWYYTRGIPYRRGYLLYGPPGLGKTLFIQALAGELDYNICILNLLELNLTDDRLNYLMNHLPARLLLLLEDIDAAFNKRQQTDELGYRSGVTFLGLLNALDGVASAEELLTFMTTNHPEKLDPALYRPGRVDVMKLVGNASLWQVEQMFKRFYGDARAEEFMDKYRRVVGSTEVSTAQLQGLFVYNKDKPERAIEMVEALVKKPE